MLSSGYLNYVDDNRPQVILLLIDPQNDFHTGSLPVPGSVEDSERIANMILKNKEYIDNVFITMDSHHQNHIAHAAFWKSDKPVKDKQGVLISRPKPGNQSLHEPKPFTIITKSDVDINNDKARVWTPVDESLKKYVSGYVEALENKNRFKLCIWPEHCLIGTRGHAVVTNIFNVVQEWSKLKRRVVNYIFKGSNNLTEMYSAIEAEVPLLTDHTTTKNHELLQALRSAGVPGGRLIVCGQARSHVVRYTVEDIIKDWKEHNGSCVLSNIFLLKDGCSDVGGFEEKTSAYVKEIGESDKVTVDVGCADAFRGLISQQPGSPKRSGFLMK